MPNDFRAKQFLPFDALPGFREALKREEIKVETKKELTDDSIDIINNIISSIKKDDTISVEYYYGIEYIETIGKVKRITKDKIILINTSINIEDIIKIEVL